MLSATARGPGVPDRRQQLGHRQVGTQIGNPPALGRRARRHHEGADLVRLRPEESRPPASAPRPPPGTPRPATPEPAGTPPSSCAPEPPTAIRWPSRRPPLRPREQRPHPERRGPPRVTAARCSTACSSSASRPRTARSASPTNSAAAELSTAPAGGIAGAGGASASRRSSSARERVAMREMLWPLAGQLPELAEPLDVVVGIEPLPALRPMGSDHPVAPLPGPEDVGRQAGAIGHQPDGMSRRIEAAVSIHATIIPLCLSIVKKITWTRA